MHSVVQFQCILVVWIHRQDSSAIPQARLKVANALVESCAQVKYLQVCFEGNRLRQFTNRFLLSAAVHQHCIPTTRHTNEPFGKAIHFTL